MDSQDPSMDTEEPMDPGLRNLADSFSFWDLPPNPALAAEASPVWAHLSWRWAVPTCSPSPAVLGTSSPWCRHPHKVSGSRGTHPLLCRLGPTLASPCPPLSAPRTSAPVSPQPVASQRLKALSYSNPGALEAKSDFFFLISSFKNKPNKNTASEV